MFPIPLRHSKSDRALRKLKKGKSLSWTTRARAHTPEIDFAAFHSGLATDEHDCGPLQRRTSARRATRIAPRNAKRDTILLDLSNNDLIPALDYAFAILDDDEVSTRSLPPPSPPPKMPHLSRGSSTSSSDMLCTPSTSAFSPTSVQSSPPRCPYVSSPLSSSVTSSSMPSARPSPQKRNTQSSLSHRAAVSFDPHELSLALAQAQASSSPDLPSPVSEHSVPFPPPAAPPATRVPLLLRKPRVHSAESSFDGHEAFSCRSYPGSSKVSLARSVSSLGHHHDVFGALSTTSLHTPDFTLSSLLAQQPPKRSPYGSLRLFSSKKSRRTPTRRASTPPPSRGRHGIPSMRPPVPALPDVFLLGAAARREASSTPPTSLARAGRAHAAM